LGSGVVVILLVNLNSSLEEDELEDVDRQSLPEDYPSIVLIKELNNNKDRFVLI